ncbi:MAG: TonB-dependent receptor domain-containing protein [Fidelibacterota bacterium]
MAQSQYVLRGNVRDGNDDEPLVAANISLDLEGIGTSTDQDGNFILSNLPPGLRKLRIAYIGYETVELSVALPTKERLKISLQRDLIQMNSLVVTGTRTERYLKDVPVTTQVLKGDRLSEFGARDISDVLEEMTGVQVVENQFGTGVELSGFDSEHILILIDGTKMIGRVNGQLDIAQIPIEQIERVEVVKGAASALYGSDAMGGVINIFTRRPEDHWSVNSDNGLGAYGRANTAISFARNFNSWSITAGGGYRHYGGFDLDPGSVWEDGSEYRKSNGLLKLGYRFPSGADLLVETNYFKEHQSLVSSSVFQDRLTNERTTSKLELEVPSKGKTTFTGVTEYSVHDHWFDRIVLSSGRLKKGSLSQDKLGTVSLRFVRKGSRQTLNGGVGLELESIQSDRVAGNGRSSSLKNVFIQDEFLLGNKWTLVGGFRFDGHSIYGSHYSPKLSLMYKPELISRIRFSYGAGFRAPSFKELFFDYSNISVGYHVIGNENLAPETSRSLNMDIERWNTNEYHARVHFYWNEIKGLIDYRFLDVIDGISTYTSENLSTARTAGVELDFTYFFTNTTEAWIGYAFLDSWDEEHESPLGLKARHKANGGLRFKLWKEVKFNLRFQYVGKRFFWDDSMDGTAPERAWIDPYTVLNANVSIPLPWGMNLYLGGKNLTDYVNQTWGPMPGREWYLGLRFDLNQSSSVNH